jgi:D-alanyl-D-alanine endopeptidase (penicillin-binding protein 7)
MLVVGLGGLPLVHAQATKAAKHATAAQPKKQAKAAKAAKPIKAAKPSARAAARRSVVRLEPPRPSFGHLYGLQETDDPLDLKSSVALVIDQDTDEVLLSKNPQAVLPIASITKLMTALVVTEARLSMDEMLVVAQDDIDATGGSRSRLRLGTSLSRGEMLHLALMSSENRAAHVLGRTYPGGMGPFVAAMNAKARLLGMTDTRYVEPTGLSSDNQSSARDLSRLVRAASEHPIIRDLSTTVEASLPVGRHQVQFHTTNGLVRNPEWDIGLQKTGYIAAAGRCLVMQTQVAGRKLIMVLLDSAGKYSRLGDAERIRKWLATAPFVPSAVAAPISKVAPVTSLAPVVSGVLVGPTVAPLTLATMPAAAPAHIQPR